MRLIEFYLSFRLGVIKSLWISSHSRISVNKTADKLAKNAVDHPIIRNISSDYLYLKRELREIINSRETYVGHMSRGNSTNLYYDYHLGHGSREFRRREERLLSSPDRGMKTYIITW